MASRGEWPGTEAPAEAQQHSKRYTSGTTFPPFAKLQSRCFRLADESEQFAT